MLYDFNFFYKKSLIKSVPSTIFKFYMKEGDKAFLMRALKKFYRLKVVPDSALFHFLMSTPNFKNFLFWFDFYWHDIDDNGESPSELYVRKKGDKLSNTEKEIISQLQNSTPGFYMKILNKNNKPVFKDLLSKKVFQMNFEDKLRFGEVFFGVIEKIDNELIVIRKFAILKPHVFKEIEKRKSFFQKRKTLVDLVHRLDTELKKVHDTLFLMKKQINVLYFRILKTEGLFSTLFANSKKRKNYYIFSSKDGYGFNALFEVKNKKLKVYVKGRQNIAQVKRFLKNYRDFIQELHLKSVVHLKEIEHKIFKKMSIDHPFLDLPEFREYIRVNFTRLLNRWLANHYTEVFKKRETVFNLFSTDKVFEEKIKGFLASISKKLDLPSVV